ncbi:hypothetical protein Unana1_00285 [Umbelopsis nana]
MTVKRVLITGGGGGIGAHMAVHFAGDHGAKVAVLDVSQGALTAMQGHLRDKPYLDQLLFVQCDVSSDESIKSALKKVIQEFGGIDAVINNAGLANPYANQNIKRLEDYSTEWFEKYIRINLIGSFVVARETAAELEKSRGCIINIASTRAYMGEPNAEGYAASKGGVLALTTALASTLGSRGVRVNAITPGWINSLDARMEQVDQFPGATNVKPWSRPCHEQHTVGRMGKGIDIAKMAWFLVTDDDGFITGQEFVVDGGMSTKMILYMDEI